MADDNIENLIHELKDVKKLLMLQLLAVGYIAKALGCGAVRQRSNTQSHVTQGLDNRLGRLGCVRIVSTGE